MPVSFYSCLVDHFGGGWKWEPVWVSVNGNMLRHTSHYNAKWNDTHALSDIIRWSKWAWFKNWSLKDSSAKALCTEVFLHYHSEGSWSYNAGTKTTMSPEPHAVRWETQAESQNVSGARPKQWRSYSIGTMLIMCGQPIAIDSCQWLTWGGITSFTNSSSSSVCKGW